MRSMLPLSVRFWRHVDKNGPIHPELGQCWNWMGRCVKGYAQLWAIQLGPNKWISKYAHHISLFLTIGEWPTQYVLHRCDNSRCVNPEHLYQGTQLQNIADRNVRGRTAFGETSSKTHLTAQDVINILRLRKYGIRMKSIMATYNISKSGLSAISSGKAWKYLDRSPANRPIPIWSTSKMGFVP